MEKLRKLLDEQLDHVNGEHLKLQLVECEAFSALLSELYRKAEQSYTDKRGRLFNPSISSEDKRKVDIEYKTAPEKYNLGILSDLSKILDRRISLGQSLLSSFKQELKSQIK